MPYYKTPSKGIPRFFWICVGLALLQLSIGVTMLLVRSSQLQYQGLNGKTLTIDTARKIKQVSNNSEYANKVLLSEIKELKTKVDSIANSDRIGDPVIQAVATELEQLQPVANEVENYSNQLSVLVDREITEDKIVAP